MADAVNNTDEAPKKDPVTPPELKEMTGASQVGPDGLTPGEDPKESKYARTKPQQPTAQNQNAAEPEEENADGQPAKKKEAVKPVNTASQNATPPAEEEEEAVSPQAKIKQEHRDVLHNHPRWQTPNISDELAETISNGSIAKSGDGLNFKLNNEHTVKWHPNIGGKEFVGMRSSFFKDHTFDETDAKAIIAVASMRGWSSMKLYGDIEQKNLLWIEAQRQGILIKGFEPSPEIQQAWEKEQEQKLQKAADKEVVGVNNDADGTLEITDDARKKLADTPPPETAEKKAPAEAGEKQPSSDPTAAENSTFFKRGQPKTAAPEETDIKVGMRDDENFEQYIDRRINENEGNSDIKQGFMEIKAALNTGKISIEDISMTALMRDTANGPKTVEEEMKGIRAVMSGKGGALNSSIENADIVASKPATEKPAATAKGLGM